MVVGGGGGNGKGSGCFSSLTCFLKKIYVGCPSLERMFLYAITLSTAEFQPQLFKSRIQHCSNYQILLSLAFSSYSENDISSRFGSTALLFEPANN